MAWTKFFRFPFALTGDKTAVPDDTQPSGSVSYEQGYGFDYSRDPASDPLAKNIERAKMNQLFYDITSVLNQYQTTGVPLFITAAENDGVAYEYEVNAQVRYDDGVNGFRTYVSLVDNNDQLPTVGTHWQVVTFGTIDIDGLTAEAAPAVGDFLPFYDVSVTGNRKITFENFLKVINALTEETSPDRAADMLALYDASGATVKKATPARVGGLVPLSAQSIVANVASIDFTSFINDTLYDEYEVHVRNLFGTVDGAEILGRISTDNGATWKSGATDYQWSVASLGNTYVGEKSAGDSKMQLCLAGSNQDPGFAGNENYNLIARLFRPSGTTGFRFLGFDAWYSISFTGEPLRTLGAAFYNATTAINGFQIFPSSGQIARAEVQIFGVRKG